MADNFGASIFPSDTGTNLVTALTGAVTDNIAVVVVILGALLGIRWSFRLVGKALKGKFGI